MISLKLSLEMFPHGWLAVGRSVVGLVSPGRDWLDGVIPFVPTPRWQRIWDVVQGGPRGLSNPKVDEDEEEWTKPSLETSNLASHGGERVKVKVSALRDLRLREVFWTGGVESCKMFKISGGVKQKWVRYGI